MKITTNFSTIVDKVMTELAKAQVDHDRAAARSEDSSAAYDRAYARGKEDALRGVLVTLYAYVDERI